MVNHSGIADDAQRFQIITSTRKIVVPSGYTVIGTVGDHNSEQLTFQCPKTVDGHDVENCAFHYVRWQNANGDTGRAEMTDITSDDEGVYMTWTVSAEVTAAAGFVSFAVYLEDVGEDGKLLYRWSTTTCSELQVVSTALGAEPHRVYESDNHFVIDPATRAIENVLSTRPTITQYDHNSSRFTFEIPRYVEGQDMSQCNRVEIHFINLAATGEQQYASMYVVDDLQVDLKDENFVTFSWLLSNEVTKYAGTVNFIIRFASVTDLIIDYSWNTVVYEGVAVVDGLNNEEVVIGYYDAALQRWQKAVLQNMVEVMGEYHWTRIVTAKEFENMTPEENIVYVFEDDTTYDFLMNNMEGLLNGTVAAKKATHAANAENAVYAEDATFASNAGYATTAKNAERASYAETTGSVRDAERTSGFSLTESDGGCDIYKGGNITITSHTTVKKDGSIVGDGISGDISRYYVDIDFVYDQKPLEIVGSGQTTYLSYSSSDGYYINTTWGGVLDVFLGKSTTHTARRDYLLNNAKNAETAAVADIANYASEDQSKGTIEQRLRRIMDILAAIDAPLEFTKTITYTCNAGTRDEQYANTLETPDISADMPFGEVADWRLAGVSVTSGYAQGQIHGDAVSFYTSNGSATSGEAVLTYKYKFV